MAPQIRLIQNNDSMMSDRYSPQYNTIPLWKKSDGGAIGLKHSSDATKAQGCIGYDK